MLFMPAKQAISPFACGGEVLSFRAFVRLKPHDLQPLRRAMRVLIYEPQFLGHNLAHAARMVRELAKLPCELTLATSRQAAESLEFAVQLGALESAFRLHLLDEFEWDRNRRRVVVTGPRGIAAAYGGLRSAIRAAEPQHVYVPYGNLLARFASWPGEIRRRLAAPQVEAETLLIGGRYVLPDGSWRGRLRRRLNVMQLARSPWTTIFHLDRRAVGEIQRLHPRLRERVRLMPDPVDPATKLERRAARRLLGLRENGKIIVVAGLIELRKGVPQLVEALRRIPTGTRLVLAGKADPAVRDWLHRNGRDLLQSDRVESLDRYLDAREFAAAIDGADVVAALYPGHAHSSSIVVAAAAAGRPVLGIDSGWIGESVRQFDLGVVCRHDNPDDVVRGLREALELSTAYRLTPRGDFFVAYNSVANFGAHWSRRLRERLELQSAPELLEWPATLDFTSPASRAHAA
ncbi:MAG: glycosyltransferase [Pirellulales bacterium]|nr:glycosyltransferase [Pirellulales bacterium]